MSNCFKGEFKAANTSLLGKNDYKKLRDKLLEEFPVLTKKSLKRVFSDKEETHVLKCSNGTMLYVAGEKPPSFFDDGFGNLYPTLFTLWKIPNMMEELVTHGPVSKFLLPRDRSAGADMMLPGVIVPEGGLGAVHVGQKRCMRVEGNDMPFAVGKMLVSDADIAAKGMKGKGMAVLHVYNDSLWAYGGRRVPNDGFGADEIKPATTDERPSGQAEPIDLEEAEAEEEEEDEADAEGGERASGQAEPLLEMPPDELIEYCFFAALKSSCTDEELPITADRFYSHHMQPARPAGHALLEAKKTSFKQIGKFIKQMHKQKYVVVREVKNEIKILSVDRESSKYLMFSAKGGASTKQTKEAEAGGGGGVGPNTVNTMEEVVRLRSKPPVITEMWQPNSYTKALFKGAGHDKEQAHAKEECYAVLRGYIETRLGPPHAMPAPDAAAEEAEAWDDDEEEAVPDPAGLSIQDSGDSGAAGYTGDMEAVPLDDLLIDSLVKLAGGAKKGTTFPSHLPLAELQSRMLERMTPMHKVEVEDEAPAIKKGALKPLKIEMKRAAGHNKTHVSGLEGLLISPDAVSQVLKIKVGCTTAVLKLPGNNVKEMEIVLQGHCVNEVVDYLREAYCVDRQWIDLGKELDRKGKKILPTSL